MVSPAATNRSTYTDAGLLYSTDRSELEDWKRVLKQQLKRFDSLIILDTFGRSTTNVFLEASKSSRFCLYTGSRRAQLGVARTILANCCRILYSCVNACFCCSLCRNFHCVIAWCGTWSPAIKGCFVLALALCFPIEEKHDQACPQKKKTHHARMVEV